MPAGCSLGTFCIFMSDMNDSQHSPWLMRIEPLVPHEAVHFRGTLKAEILEGLDEMSSSHKDDGNKQPEELLCDPQTS